MALMMALILARLMKPPPARTGGSRRGLKLGPLFWASERSIMGRAELLIKLH